MEEDGVTPVVSGFGNRITAAGGGKVTAVVINGMAGPDRMEIVPIIRRIVRGGHYRARMVVAATTTASRRSGVTAVSTE